MTLKNISENQILKIKSLLINFLVPNNNDNIKYTFKKDKCTITIYKTNTLLLQGDIKSILSNELSFLNEKTKRENTQDLIGCDESGVGDYFGPVVFACAYISPNDQNNDKIKKLLVDSKTLNDKDIINYYEEIIKYAKYEVFVDEVYSFNKKMEESKNQNYLKVVNYYNLLKSFLDKNNDLREKVIILDQFTTLEAFKKHARNIDKHGVKFALSTKAESKFLNVACASIIARRHYLLEIEKLEKKYNIKIKKGADNIVKKLVEDYKKNLPNEWENFIKKHFK